MELTQLKTDTLAYLARWKKGGKKIATYLCPLCDKVVMTTQPSKNLCAEGRSYWDSAKTCYECGGVFWIAVYVSGKVVTKRF